MPSSSRFPSPVRAAAVEALERRQLFATIPLGELGLGHRADYATPYGTTNYTFSLTKPATLDVHTTEGTASIKRNGVVMSSGEKFSRPLASGNYSIEVNAKGGSSLLVKTSTFSPPTRLEAEVWSGKVAKLNWDDNSDAETQYRVDRWTRSGWRRSVRVGQDVTAVVIDNLVPGFATTYRVSAVTVEGVSFRSANVVSLTTPNLDESGWYKLSISAAKKGEAGWTMKPEHDTLKIWPEFQDESARVSHWVYASSWQAAVWQYAATLRSSSDEIEPVRVNTGRKDGSSDVYISHYLPGSGSFRINTVGELKKQIGSYANNNGGFKVAGAGITDSTKVISIEDSYESVDRDYDDFYWLVDAEKLPSGADIVAFRLRDPQYSQPISGSFAKEQRQISEANEELPGEGVRVRPDRGFASHALVDIELALPHAPTDISYVLKRENSATQAFSSASSTSALFFGEDTEAVLGAGGDRAYAVGIKDATAGSLELWAYEHGANGARILLDKIDLVPSRTHVTAFSGETFYSGDPLENGVYEMARSLYEQGYSVGYYNVNGESDEAELATRNLLKEQVNQLAILGHSHGGGETFRLSRALANATDLPPFELAYTAYIDAIQHDSTFEAQAEDRLPRNTLHHENFYQTISYGLNGVPIAGADWNLNVSTTTWGSGLTHTSIDNDPTVIAMVIAGVNGYMSA